MSAIPEELRITTETWIAGDPDPTTRNELQKLLDEGDVAELRDRMNGSLMFGTAGLRGRVEAGSNRMNRAVVIRATRGLAEYLTGRESDSEHPVVIGRDARLSSEAFMRDAVGVLAAAGIIVRFFPDPVPTPLVAYAARVLGARAAIVITASHNPRYDNGYKVYDSNGAQIIPPVDVDIARSIEGVVAAAEVPRLTGEHLEDIAQSVPPGMFGRYLEDLATVRAADAVGSDLTIVYTPLHGVGGAFTTGALRHFGHSNVRIVASQYEPDGHFPTVEYPNPEEPGALDRAIELAGAVDADLIVANDPDTDRLAIAVARSDGWRPLTGNQIGVLLGDYVLEKTSLERPIVLSSIVSSPMLGRIATARHAVFAQTLTGFKWIWNAALDLEEAQAGTFVFGYEEALGYSVGPAVRDKDGISAAVVFVDMVADSYRHGESLLDRLAALYRRYGLWVSTQKSVVRPGSEGAAEISAAMERVATAPPTVVDGLDVASVTNYLEGAEDRPRYLGATNLIELDLAERGRALVRPSGTEPKLKIYVDLVGRLPEGAELDAHEPALVAEAERVATSIAEQIGF